MRLLITGITGSVGRRLALGHAEVAGRPARSRFDQTLADLLEYWRQRIPVPSR
jgi:hypothetical protein